MTEPPQQPYSYPPPVDPFSTGSQQPAPAPPVYYGYEPQPTYPPPPPPKKKRRGLMITAIVFGVVLVLCASGSIAAYLYLKDGGGKGADTASAAVNDFLVAVYSDHDTDKAEKLVCPEARKKSDLTKKIDEIKKYREGYKEPKFTWPEPTVAEQKDDSAKLTVTVKVTTDDEKSIEQPLRFVAVRKDGWFVCEVQAGA